MATMCELLPESFKQWIVTGKDGVGSLQYVERPLPHFGDNEVLVRSKFGHPAILTVADETSVKPSPRCQSQRTLFHI